MKKVLILGAGRGQVGLIRAAQKLGHEAIVASIPGDYPGFSMADKIVYADLRDTEAISRLAGDLCVDAIVAAGADLALPALGAACEDNGLKGPDRKTANASADKSLMKAAFAKYGVRTARHLVIRSEEEARNSLMQLEMPVIVKAIDLGGSRGINIVFDESDIEDAFRKTMSVTHANHCIVEEYIDGHEVSATALVADGEVLFVLPMGDVRFGKNDEIPIGHYVPLDCDAGLINDIEMQVCAAIKAIGLNDCAVNADIMTKDGKAYVLELTGRLGANAIPEITSAYYEKDIHELIVKVALAEYEDLKSIDFDSHTDGVCFGQMLFSETGGKLESTYIDDDKCDAWFFKKEGAVIAPFRSPGDCLGQVVVIDDCLEKCRQHIGRILDQIRVKY